MDAKEAELPWVEKYRPISFDQVTGNEEKIQRLRVLGKEGPLPNLLLCGPPGCGKTTSIVCIALQSLGKEKWKEGVLMINGSDERKIAVVRGRIRDFAQKKLDLVGHQRKIIILDEADSLPAHSQQALRFMMTKYLETTRFVIICNRIAPIVAEIQSRCTLLRFEALSSEAIAKRLKQIIAEEKLVENKDYDQGGLQALLDTSEGDLRQAIANLQSTWTGLGQVNEHNVYMMVDQPMPKQIHDIFLLCSQKKTLEAMKAVDKLKREAGYATEDIIKSFEKQIERMKEFLPAVKLAYAREIGSFKTRISEGCNSNGQLFGLIGGLCLLSQKN